MIGRLKNAASLIALTLALAAPAGAQQAPAAPPAGGVNDVLSMPRVDPQLQYLVENQKKPGWQVTPSGLQYRVVRRVAGNPPRPLLSDEVTVNYRGVLIDGKEFDSSYGRGRPATFPVNRLVRGWQEALVMMRVGEQWELAVPGNLGYGLRGQPDGGIPPNATLLFTVELLGIRKPDTTNLLAKPGTIR
jgi:FKBP-type peptidyl-prolyl cis-trans isomerase FkpA